VELRVELPSVIAVLASVDACDRVVAGLGGDAMRVAPREVLVLGTDEPTARAAADEPGALVDDVSDGWVAVVLLGDLAHARDVIARVSELRQPAEGWLQGDVARAAAKIRIDPDAGRVTILVPAMLAAHVEELGR
jgi:hypothetical protein